MEQDRIFDNPNPPSLRANLFFFFSAGFISSTSRLPMMLPESVFLATAPVAQLLTNSGYVNRGL